jgi:protein-S-isoprenylcysteine O-methyltransferase Ste14
MRIGHAVAGTAGFFAVAPGVVCGVVPWLLTRWEVGTHLPSGLRLIGALVVAIGALLLVNAFVRFVAEGAGTPAPVAPTDRLVVGGLYRWVRNPMYLAVLATILGQALLLGRPLLVGYAVVVGIAVAAFVRFYEEPTLADRYGAAYEDYRRSVPAWLPRRPRDSRP